MDLKKDNSVINGKLLKHRFLSFYEDKWVCLKDRMLVAYQTKEDLYPCCIIPFDVYQCSVEKRKSTKCGFKIAIAGYPKKFKFNAPNEKEAAKWKTEIEQQI